ncbi:MAG: hypothetical protein AAF763_10200 [Pseudomonadota bacterium]
MSLAASELRTLRDALERALYRGVRSVSVDGREVTYSTVSEMRAALADAERRLAAAEGGAPVSQVRITTTKGL